MNNTKDKYSTFDELIKECLIGEDYFIEFNDLISPVSVIAIHGGGCEGGTTEIAQKIAELGQYRYYSFLGMRKQQTDCQQNLELHITSNKFLDSRCLEIVGRTIATISIHGADEEEALSYVGGKNFIHADFIKNELKNAGFIVPDRIRKGLEGYGPLNICNRNMKCMGVQLELSQGLRTLLFDSNWKFLEARQQNSSKLIDYCKAIHIATQKYLCTL